MSNVKSTRIEVKPGELTITVKHDEADLYTLMAKINTALWWGPGWAARDQISGATEFIQVGANVPRVQIPWGEYSFED